MTAMANPTEAFEVPEEVRAFAEKGVLQARDNYAKFKEAAQDGNGAVEAVFNAATKGAHAYSAKLLDFGQANTNASFDFLQALVGAKSLSDATELWSTHTRNQFGTFAVQAKELTELTQKIAAETAEPIRTGASKLFQPTV
ncbi:phasin [Nitrobacter vulgaris]|jgi:phasin|uniref:Phasin n=1 Tax=Nitrobacter vulgaris TaxID=29421 RepID=A0A1V4I1D5_NITVU|nr:phasin [Nitrobacter vulgaris]